MVSVIQSSRVQEPDIITAVHYTHATATFTASLLLRLARLLYVMARWFIQIVLILSQCSPAESDTVAIRNQVELLANLMSESK